jgi:CheY-like chemotaxis protein
MTLAIQTPREPTLLPVAEMDREVAVVVEDDPDTRARITTSLHSAGWRVYQAPDGERGLCSLKNTSRT